MKRNTKLQLKKKWIYIEIGQDTDTKYGEISLDHLNLINDNENSEKIIMISNARYIDELDSIVKKVSEYDEHKSGTFYYKIKTIDYLEVLKKDPFETKVEINE